MTEPQRRPDEPAQDPVVDASAVTGAGTSSDPPPGESTAAMEATATSETAVPETAVAPETVTTAEAVAATEAAADATSVEARPSRRPAVVAAIRKMLVFVLTVAIFAGGVALGVYAFQSTRPAPATIGGPLGSTSEPPAVAREFISALAANDADALRSSLDRDPHLDLTREMDKFGIQRIENVEVLGTHVDGVRSATEILMEYQSEDGIPFAINLVILVDGAKIEGFR